jgi:hypothetical protein
VEGASGTGKSSLVRAGLLPTIRRGKLDEDERRTTTAWLIAEPMRPGENPVEGLAVTLANLFQDDLTGLDARLSDPKDDSGRALRLMLREARFIPSETGLLLVVDQFEELFTLTKDPGMRPRFDALPGNALTDGEGPLHLITTIRNDFLHRMPELPRLWALLDQGAMGRYLLAPITPAGLRDLISSPARLVGLEWDPGLPEQIIEEALREPGALPLVANLLRLPWDGLEGGKRFTWTAYKRLGGLGGALARSADRLLGALSESDQQRARCLLLALIEPVPEGQAARRTITKTMALDAAGGGSSAELVLERLAGGRGGGTSKQARALLDRLAESYRRGKGGLIKDRRQLRRFRPTTAGAVATNPPST